MPSNARTVSDYILAFFQWKGDPITNLKLQKLLYYVQGWHLALHDEPAFPERIEAWIPGPVCPEVYGLYEGLRWLPITEEVKEPTTLDERLVAVIDEVLQLYGVETGWQLELRTHRERPWMQARKGLTSIDDCTEEITHSSMKRFFQAEAAAAQEGP